jgi:pilus assembly protein Flp/PilA
VNQVVGIFSAIQFAGSWLATRLNVKSERGATAVEYGVMVALIAAVIIAAVVFLGHKTSSTFSCTASAISSKNGNC